MDRINTLFGKYQNNQCNRKEIEELLEYFRIEAHEELLKSSIESAIADGGSDSAELESDTAEVYSSIQKQILSGKPRNRRLSPLRWAVAASLFLALSISVMLFMFRQPSGGQVALNQKTDIAPGRNQATLTLANGQKIILKEGLTGTLAQQGTVQVSVGQNSLNYIPSGAVSDAPVGYNTLSTANGEQSPYPLVLADGTKIWLNARSSIRFPTSFKGSDRTVQLTGEAYFEVVHNSSNPFEVTVNGQTVEDIGTQFNINAYEDEPVLKTTLLEGEVKISNAGETALLKPGQQSQISGAGKIRVTNDADIEEAIAWKNGLFKFSHADIKTVMRQFSRWYNLSVVYEGAIPTDGISGKIYRNVNASQAMDILKYLDIHYRIEKNKDAHKIIITP